MGVVAVPSSASRSPFASGCGGGLSADRSPSLRRLFFPPVFSGCRVKCSAVVSPQEAAKETQKSLTRAKPKQPSRAKVASVDAAPTAAAPSADADCPHELDYNEFAAALENIYKLSPAEVSDVEEEGASSCRRRLRGRGKRRWKAGEEEKEDGELGSVRHRKRRSPKRLSLEERVALKRKGKEEGVVSERKQLDVDVERLVRDYSVSTHLASLDWKRMKIPPVLSSSEHTWLFKLMQPMKAIFKVKQDLQKDLNREPTDGELAAAINMSVPQMKRHIEVGQAARNKLIKHNLRLVLFVINKYYPEFASEEKFQDLCQAGVQGLVTAIDRFEPKRGFRLSTYGLFWIRHSIIRSMTVSSFMRVPFGIESARQEIQKAKLQLQFELGRVPTDDEIINRVGISPERYHDIMKTSKPVYSLNARHVVTQEEFIKGVTDIDGVGGNKRRQLALLRLALDDVLDSLKPKESLVIRQRYGLDGKGDRTLGEIAGNLNISREMVRKHELKALMKLKHPTRVDYVRRYI